MIAGKRFILGIMLSLALLIFSWPGARPAQASCGAVTCFVVIGSQQQVPTAGLLTVNAIYNYTPMRLLDGTNGVIPGIDQQSRQMILNHHEEARTVTQQATLDLNYGLTERFGLQLTLPYMWRSHHHIDGLGEDGANGEGEATNFHANGAGDIRVGLKYNVLPTIRSMVVLGFGVYLPSGNTHAQDNVGGIMESTSQLGRGAVGLNPTIYQTYELIPHRLNQFASASYRHTFRNNDGYQFGDQWDLNGGLNIVTAPWLVLSTQLNYRYMVHDNFSSSLLRSATPADGAAFPGEPIVIDPTIKNRPVPTTGSTFLSFTPGFQVSLAQLVDSPWTSMTSVYFHCAIPVMRDSNNSLAQGTSYIFGLTRSFQML